MPHFDQTTAEIVHFALTWTGFGTLVGLTAKAIMPGRDPGGILFTWGLGIAGGLVGNVVLTLLTNEPFDLMTPYGICAAIAGAFGLLFIYRVSDGKFWEEEEESRDTRTTPTIRGLFESSSMRRRSRRRQWRVESAESSLEDSTEPEMIERTSRELLREARSEALIGRR